MNKPIRIRNLTPQCRIPGCSRCAPAEVPPELAEAIRRPAAPAALLAFGFTGKDTDR